MVKPCNLDLEIRVEMVLPKSLYSMYHQSKHDPIYSVIGSANHDFLKTLTHDFNMKVLSPDLKMTQGEEGSQ